MSTVDLKMASKAIEEIANASGSIEKEILLKKHAEVVMPVLRFIYNPYCKTGISAAKLLKGIQMTAGGVGIGVSFEEITEHLTKHNTGSDADLIIAANFVRTCINEYDAGELAKAIVTQNLQIGVNVTTLNKVYGSDFIPKVGCMLGTLYANVKNVKWPCIVTEKLDGVRRILIKENGVCKCYSRSGHEDTGLVEIMDDAHLLPNNFVYDGELLAAGEFKDCIEQRQATNSLSSMKGDKTGLIFNVFDMIPLEDFYAGVCTDPAIERKIRLAATFMDDSLEIIDEQWAQRQVYFGMPTMPKHIVSVPILGLVNNIAQATPIAEKIWARGGEGIMLNTTTGPYEIKRSKELIKIKHTEEVVLPVINILEGEGKYEDSLGAIVVEYKGNCVGVGSGFTDDQRKYIWENPEEFIGRLAEIETFGESKNAQGYYSINCPIFKRFVDDVE